MSTEWFYKHPGSDISPSRDEEGMFLMGLDRPDWVNVPDHPGLPGGKRKVLAVVNGMCCYPGHNHAAVHYILEGPVSCCECVPSGLFQWYRNKNEPRPSAGDEQPSSQGNDEVVS